MDQDCPLHPTLGFRCERTDPTHTLCIANTSHGIGYSATWVRVWWRDGRPMRSTQITHPYVPLLEAYTRVEKRYNT